MLVIMYKPNESIFIKLFNEENKTMSLIGKLLSGGTLTRLENLETDKTANCLSPSFLLNFGLTFASFLFAT